MTTNNAVNTPLSGTTGTGNFVGSTSPALITPNIGVATATSLAFSPTTEGIIGTTVADSASAGKVGEYVISTILAASAVSYASTATPINITSISLTAGDWDVGGNVVSLLTSGNYTSTVGWISTTSATGPDPALASQVNYANAVTNGLVVPTIRLNISGTTTVYLSSQITFVTAVVKGCGTIWARRIR
jgi:hypothetical protein